MKEATYAGQEEFIKPALFTIDTNELISSIREHLVRMSPKRPKHIELCKQTRDNLINEMLPLVRFLDTKTLMFDGLEVVLNRDVPKDQVFLVAGEEQRFPDMPIYMQIEYSVWNFIDDNKPTLSLEKSSYIKHYNQQTVIVGIDYNKEDIRKTIAALDNMVYSLGFELVERTFSPGTVTYGFKV